MKIMQTSIYLKRTSKIGTALIVIFTVFLSLNSSTQEEISTNVDISKYVYSQEGTIPIILEAPHGGDKTISELPSRESDCSKESGDEIICSRDRLTLELTKNISEEIEKILSEKPYVFAAEFSRNYIDVNHNINDGYFDSRNPNFPKYKEYYNQYFEGLYNVIDKTKNRHASPILLDFHGSCNESIHKPCDYISRGTRDGNTVSHLRSLHGDQSITGRHSIMNNLKNLGYFTSPNLEKELLFGDEPYNGGCVIVNSNNQGIDAIQFEIGGELRNSDNISKLAKDFATSISDFYEHYIKGKIQRREDFTAGGVNLISTEYVGRIYSNGREIGNRIITAVSLSGSNKLKLICWDIMKDGSIVRKGDIEAGGVSDISVEVYGGDVTSSGYSLVITAVRANEKLKIISWHLKGNGTFERKDDEVYDQQISNVEIKGVLGYSPTSRVITAILSKTDNTMKLITWDIDFVSGVITRKNVKEESTKASDVSLTYNEGHLIAAIKSVASGKLVVKSYKVFGDERGVVSKDGETRNETIDNVKVTGAGQSSFVTVSRKSDKINLTSWKITSNGEIEFKDDIEVKYISDFSIASSGSMVLTAVKLQNGRMSLKEWNINSSTGKINRGDCGFAGEVSNMSVINLGMTSSFVTAVKVKEGRLKVIRWDVN